MSEQYPVTYGGAQSVRLDEMRLALDSGMLGKFFGASKNAAVNIAGLIALILLVPGVLMLFIQSIMPAADYLKTILPIITLILGYLFGRHNG